MTANTRGSQPKFWQWASPSNPLGFSTAPSGSQQHSSRGKGCPRCLRGTASFRQSTRCKAVPDSAFRVSVANLCHTPTGIIYTKGQTPLPTEHFCSAPRQNDCYSVYNLKKNHQERNILPSVKMGARRGGVAASVNASSAIVKHKPL